MIGLVWLPPLFSAATRDSLEGRHVEHVHANLLDVALLKTAAAADPPHPAVDAQGRLGVGAVRAGGTGEPGTTPGGIPQLPVGLAVHAEVIPALWAQTKSAGKFCKSITVMIYYSDKMNIVTVSTFENSSVNYSNKNTKKFFTLFQSPTVS